MAKQVYEEFCDLTKCKLYNDYDLEMLDSDNATQVNEKVKGHTDQLKAMFASDEFPEIEMPVPLTEVLFEKSNSNSSDSSKCKSKKKMSKQSKGQKFTKRQQADLKRDSTVSEASSKSQASAASSTS